jgi:hypothetical protein
MAISADYFALGTLTEVAMAGYLSNGPTLRYHCLVKFKEV